MATTYIANEARKLGLVPAGEDGTYFQDVPFTARAFSRRTVLKVDDRTIAGFTGVVALPLSRALPRSIDDAQVIFGGEWGDNAHSISQRQASGRLVLFVAPNGLGRLTTNSELPSAAGFAVVSGDTFTPEQIAVGRTPVLTQRAQAGVDIAPATIIVTRSAAEALMGRSLDGVRLGAHGKRVQGNLVYDQAAVSSRNVIAVLPGTDPMLKGQYVALGAHSDHVGVRVNALDHDSLHLTNARKYFAIDNPSGAPLTEAQRARRAMRLAAVKVNLDSIHAARPIRRDSIHNGADDDGSGTVTLLEVAEAFAKGKVKPKRSLLFVWHTGEELGMLGSHWFVEHPTVPRDSIVAQINIDMVGRGAARDLAAGSDNYLQLVGSRRLSTELGNLVESVNDAQKAPFTLDYAYDANGHRENIYCRSDHANYARYGIPVVFFTTGMHGDYHQVTDEPQYIDYPHMARIGNFVFTLTNRLAELSHRPVVDKPKPDPKGACRQ